MTRHACAYCGRPVPDLTGERVGVVRFDSQQCIRDWFSLPRHDRRQQARPVAWERRAG